ncbi:MAG: polymerase [Clostridiaceae bacterium]|jgi:DNA polymerase-1|nr:polymerase [Clostridiaceae bacterium]
MTIENIGNKENIVFIIDAMNLMHRSFYAYPNLKSKTTGISTGAFFGFVQYIKGFVNKYNPKHIIVCSDAHRKTFRNDIYPAYKANRKETDEALREQFPLMEEYLKLANVPFIKKDRYEADDLIGTLSKKAKLFGYKPYVVSGDSDLHQLINEDVTQLYIGTKNTAFMGGKEVAEKYDGLLPSNMIDFKSLTGDTSDNIPGVAGIGRVSAIKLLKEYKTLEGIYENIESLKGKQRENLERDKDIAFMSKTLVTIKCDMDLNFNGLFNPDTIFQLGNKNAVTFLRGLDIQLFKNEEIVENEELKLPFDIIEDNENNVYFQSILKYPGCVSKEGLEIYVYSLLFDDKNRNKLKEMILNAKSNLLNEFDSNKKMINKLEMSNSELMKTLGLI